MATFDRLGRIETTELVGGNKTRRVRQYSFMEQPDGVYFEWRDPAPFANAGRVSAVAKDLANRIEGVLGLPGVTGAAYSQNIGANGQLVDEWTVYWQTPGGKSSGDIEDIKQANFRPAFVGPLVSQAIADAEAEE